MTEEQREEMKRRNQLVRDLTEKYKDKLLEMEAKTEEEKRQINDLLDKLLALSVQDQVAGAIPLSDILKKY
jgi:vacuolar-type H+-ATPase subunit E/Vma4